LFKRSTDSVRGSGVAEGDVESASPGETAAVASGADAAGDADGLPLPAEQDEKQITSISAAAHVQNFFKKPPPSN